MEAAISVTACVAEVALAAAVDDERACLSLRFSSKVELQPGSAGARAGAAGIQQLLWHLDEAGELLCWPLTSLGALTGVSRRCSARAADFRPVGVVGRCSRLAIGSYWG